MDAMLEFYTRAFGFTFEPHDTYGLASQFGYRDGLTLKFVPIRDSADFVGFPVHQLGFAVPDVEAVVALASRLGGRVEGVPETVRDSIHAAIRDPDGNTIELYGPRPASSP
jgi:catechol 2,3-dioxygenase-like lactoylglutathione lyase family enzyme